MKQANFFGLILTFPLLIASCSTEVAPSKSNTASSTQSSSGVSISSSERSESTSSALSSQQDITSIEESVFSEDKTSEEAITSEEVITSEEGLLSSAEESKSQKPDGPKSFTFYSVNDFHGAIKEGDTSSGYYKAGVAKYFGELAERKQSDPEHTVLLSAGDMWQGSLESNNSQGLFVTEAMSAAGFDAMAMGNHEFDFGIENIKSNAEVASFPFLGGNIMNFEDGWFTQTRNELFDISKVIERDGIKIGIIGMIGAGLTTSITSRNVASLWFDDPIPHAIAEATRLKEEENTSINVLIVHADASSVTELFNFEKEDGSTLDMYFDVVFCAHSHRMNNECVDGVPMLQAYSKGEAYSKATITINEGEVIERSGSIEFVDSLYSTNENVNDVVDKYMTDELIALGNRQAGFISGYIDKRGVGALGCKAIFERYKDQYPDLACAMMNSQREGLSGTVTYSDIFEATPFANNIVIANIKGSDIISEAVYNPTYTGDIFRFGTIDADKYYTCAVIDYLFYHTNVTKQYDYFKGNRPGGGNEVVAEYVTHPYELIYDYFKTAEENTIDPITLSGRENGFDLYYGS